MSAQKVVIGAVGFGLGAAVGYFIPHPKVGKIFDLCVKLENGEMTAEQFVYAIYHHFIGQAPSADSLEYWLGRWNEDPLQELDTNFYADTRVPIVGLNGEDSTRARTFAMLIIRSLISKSARGFSFSSCPSCQSIPSHYALEEIVL